MVRLLSRFYLWLGGWKVEGTPPATKKYIIIAAPHTSNWDVPVMLSVAGVLGVRLRWMVKDTLFWPPLGWLLSALGGVPINRRAKNNMVDQMVDLFNRSESLVLLIPPEGTRSRAEHWKSGFYYIALKAKVPLELGFIDFAERRTGFGPRLIPSGDVDADMEKMRQFYEPIKGYHPECFGPIRLRPLAAGEERRT